MTKRASFKPTLQVVPVPHRSPKKTNGLKQYEATNSARISSPSSSPISSPNRKPAHSLLLGENGNKSPPTSHTIKKRKLYKSSFEEETPSIGPSFPLKEIEKISSETSQKNDILSIEQVVDDGKSLELGEVVLLPVDETPKIPVTPLTLKPPYSQNEANKVFSKFQKKEKQKKTTNDSSIFSANSKRSKPQEITDNNSKQNNNLETKEFHNAIEEEENSVAEDLLSFNFMERPQKVYSRKGKTTTKSTAIKNEEPIESPEPIEEKKEGSSATNPVDLLASEPSQLEHSLEITNSDGTKVITRTNKSSTRSQKAKVITVFPSASDKNAITITEKDIEVLEPLEFLNDTIIEFYLKYLENQMKRKDIHFFNTFFYKKLLAGYENVRKWTKDVDIFSKKFLFVPINESYHWYLAVICLLESKHCIVTLDSLGGRHPKVGTVLRKYLTREWKDKKKDTNEKTFSAENMPGRTAKVPAQENYSDCGVFLLHYAEVWCKTSESTMPELTDQWFPNSDIETKRDTIRDIILDMNTEFAESYRKEREERIALKKKDEEKEKQEKEKSEEQKKKRKDKDKEEDNDEEKTPVKEKEERKPKKSKLEQNESTDEEKIPDRVEFNDSEILIDEETQEVENPLQFMPNTEIDSIEKIIMKEPFKKFTLELEEEEQ